MTFSILNCESPFKRPFSIHYFLLGLRKHKSAEIKIKEINCACRWIWQTPTSCHSCSSFSSIFYSTRWWQNISQRMKKLALRFPQPLVSTSIPTYKVYSMPNGWLKDYNNGEYLSVLEEVKLHSPMVSTALSWHVNSVKSGYCRVLLQAHFTCGIQSPKNHWFFLPVSFCSMTGWKNTIRRY